MRFATDVELSSGTFNCRDRVKSIQAIYTEIKWRKSYISEKHSIMLMNISLQMSNIMVSKRTKSIIDHVSLHLVTQWKPDVVDQCSL